MASNWQQGYTYLVNCSSCRSEQWMQQRTDTEMMEAIKDDSFVDVIEMETGNIKAAILCAQNLQQPTLVINLEY